MTAIVNPITIVSLNKKIGSINGGELIKITGTGFPLTLKSGLQIKVGANLIEGANFIMSSNN